MERLCGGQGEGERAHIANSSSTRAIDSSPTAQGPAVSTHTALVEGPRSIFYLSFFAYFHEPWWLLFKVPYYKACHI